MMLHKKMFNYSIFIVLCYAEFIYSVPLASAPTCTTPNNEQGQCISILCCKALQKSLILSNQSTKAFIQASKCEGNFTVCCGTLSNWKTPEIENEYKKPSDLELNATTHELRKKYAIEYKLLPSLRYCGFQHSDDHYNFGNITALDEFPWLVHIPRLSEHLKTPSWVDYKCGGVLLSNRFVLTSLQCALGGPLNYVKIGQYNKLQNRTCVASLNYEECTDTTITVETTVKHAIPDTNLLLLKLNKEIKFTDYVRPICLSLNELHRAKVGQTVITSGWGEADIKGSTIKIKKKIIHQVVNDSICNENGKDKNVCFLGNTTNNYVCEGDEGGPLMYSHNHQWFLQGIVYLPSNISSIERCIKDTVGVSERITAKTMEDLINYIFSSVQIYNDIRYNHTSCR